MVKSAKQMKYWLKAHDLTGKTLGDQYVISFEDFKGRVAYFRVRCQCGNTRTLSMCALRRRSKFCSVCRPSPVPHFKFCDTKSEKLIKKEINKEFKRKMKELKRKMI